MATNSVPQVVFASEWVLSPVREIKTPEQYATIAAILAKRQDIKYPPNASMVSAIAAILFVIIGVGGNLITIFALAKSAKLRKHATTWFVISLCVSDLTFCAFNLSLTATRFIYRKWIFSDFLCQLFPFFFYANFGVSLFNIMLIAINRFLLISRNQHYERVYTPTKRIIMIVAVWLFSFALLTPPLIGVWGKMGLDKQTYSCTILKKNGQSPKKILFIFGIFLPFLVVCYCYTKIIIAVLNNRKNLSSSVQSNNKPSLRKKDVNLTKTMMLIFGCFIICFFPLMIVNVFDDKLTYPVIHMTASVLAWASAVVNPIVYVASSQTYRKAYFELFGCSSRKNIMTTKRRNMNITVDYEV